MYSQHGDREQLEISEARVIYGTYCVKQDREQVLQLVKRAEKWFGSDSAKRILGYVKQMRDGELE